jgi:Calcineurin-like phosphoesterase
VRYLVVGDVHLSDKPPSIRTETYKDDVLAKLRWCVELAIREEAQAIIQAGDIFHIKTPSRTSHELVLETAQTLTDGHEIPVLIVPGNHDLQNDRLESLSSQPLGALAMHPQIDIFIGRNAKAPDVFAIPYLANLESSLPGWATEWAEKQEPLIITHAPLFPDGVCPPYDHMEASVWADHFPEAWATYYGHIHDSHDVYNAGGTKSLLGMTMINRGALSRGSIHENTLRRVPQVTYIDTGVQSIDGYQVPHRPAREVFRLAEKEKLDDRQTDLEQFLSAVGSTTLTGLSLEEVAARAREADLDELAVKMVLECCEVAGS